MRYICGHPNGRIPLELEYADRTAGRHLPEAGLLWECLGVLA